MLKLLLILCLTKFISSYLGQKLTMEQFLNKIPKSVVKNGKVIDIRNSLQGTITVRSTSPDDRLSFFFCSRITMGIRNMKLDIGTTIFENIWNKIIKMWITLTIGKNLILILKWDDYFKKYSLFTWLLVQLQSNVTSYVLDWFVFHFQVLHLFT